ncbi:MAG: hypothetical protein E4H36_11725 [Spirochaetales bacterium]|nr:MAG: hypothetical protein E4H36_11725 [Spirochaetales bacterium]
MICKEYIGRYLKLDNHETLPILLRFHVFFCHACREEIEKMEGLFSGMDGYISFHAPSDFTDRVLAVIQNIELEHAPRKTSPIKYWFIVGFLLVLSTIVIQFAKPNVQVRLFTGGTVDLPLNIIFAAVCALYLVIFIGSHLQEVSEFLKIHRSH